MTSLEQQRKNLQISLEREEATMYAAGKAINLCVDWWAKRYHLHDITTHSVLVTMLRARDLTADGSEYRGVFSSWFDSLSKELSQWAASGALEDRDARSITRLLKTCERDIMRAPMQPTKTERETEARRAGAKQAALTRAERLKDQRAA